MLAAPRPLSTPEEYLEAERRSPVRSELIDGEIVAMTGASRAHNQIVWNLAVTLDPLLRSRGCQGFVSDMRVRISATDLFTYPDLAVVCGEPRFDDVGQDTLLNPVLLAEVLSPSTELYDRGRKFSHYRTLDSLREYVLIAQDEVRVEIFTRQGDQTWLFTEDRTPEAVLELPALQLSVPLAAIYRGVRE
jgi:Uma2 family endonuclease